MTEIEIATAFRSVLYLTGLWIFAFWLFRDLAVDEFRQRLFEARDHLFDLAADGAIGFSHPAYVKLRAAMNAQLRFAHRLSLPFILLRIALRQTRADATPSLEDLAAELPEPTRAAVLALRDRMHVLLIYHAILGSPVAVATVVMPAVVLIAVKRHGAALLRMLGPRLQAVDADVERGGLAMSV